MREEPSSCAFGRPSLGPTSGDGLSLLLGSQRSEGMSFAQALNAVQAVRPQAQGFPPNKGFRQQLERLMLYNCVVVFRERNYFLVNK